MLIGIGAGALVLLIGIAVLVFFLLNQAPNLTSQQFDSVFAKGDKLANNTIDKRQTGTPNAATTDDKCSKAVNSALRSGEDWFVSTAGDKMIIAGVRFNDGGAAEKAYGSLETPCSQERTSTGSTEGATYQVITLAGQANAVIVRLGNAMVVAATDPKENYDVKQIATEVAKEIKNSAK